VFYFLATCEGNSEGGKSKKKVNEREGMVLNDENECGFIGKDCAYVQSTRTTRFH